MALKFDDCRSCRFRRKPAICGDCDVGELYEDEDSPGLDFTHNTGRFGDAVTTDEPERNFDPNRFLDSLEDQDDSDDEDPDA